MYTLDEYCMCTWNTCKNIRCMSWSFPVLICDNQWPPENHCPVAEMENLEATRSTLWDISGWLVSPTRHYPNCKILNICETLDIILLTINDCNVKNQCKVIEKLSTENLTSCNPPQWTFMSYHQHAIISMLCFLLLQRDSTSGPWSRYEPFRLQVVNIQCIRTPWPSKHIATTTANLHRLKRNWKHTKNYLF